MQKRAVIWYYEKNLTQSNKIAYPVNNAKYVQIITYKMKKKDFINIK